MRTTTVLLPGNMCDSRMWVKALRDGVGSAIDADLTQDDTIIAMAARALASSSGDLIPIGFSMGGIVALAMCLISPHRIAGLALFDTNPSADLPERAASRPRQQADVQAGRLESVVVQELTPHYLAASNAANPAIVSLVLDMALTLGAEVFVRQSEALRTRPDLWPILNKLNIPTLIACGEEDRLCPPAWHHAMAKAARHSTLQIFPNAGHLLPLEQPDPLAAEVAQWFNTLPERHRGPRPC